MKGDESMKCLKIENGKGFFAQSNGKMQPIDKMTKDDILYLLSVATNSESEFEMDSLENHELLNEAHKIIYRSLYSKFFELLSNKTRFIEESASTYKEALDKYQEQHITD